MHAHPLSSHPQARPKRAPARRAAALLCMALAGPALAVPGNDADPPMPPTDFGNLFDENVPRVRACQIDASRSDSSKVTVTFRTNFPHNRLRYRTSATAWSSVSPLTAAEYVYNAPASLWAGGRVEIIGCTDAAGNCRRQEQHEGQVGAERGHYATFYVIQFT